MSAMLDQSIELVISAAREAHRTHWRMSGDEGTGDRLAALVTSAWQDRLRKHDRDRFHIECPIADHLRERIDVVDLVLGVAYELKVSPNNVHMEFYRDIFKVILARDHRLPTLSRFLFLTPKSAADKLLRGMGKAVADDAHRLGLEVKIIGL